MSEDEVEATNYREDDEPVNPRAHRNLLQAISSLGKAQHIRRTTRNESEKQPDEFQLVKGAQDFGDAAAAAAHPVGINDIVKILKTTSKHVQVGKNLKNVVSTTKVVPVPLEKPAAERIKRTIGYDNVKAKLARWDAVVAKNRSSETQIFPLPAETVFIDTSAHAKPLQLAVKSDLVREMEETEAKLAALRKERSGEEVRDPKQVESEEQLLLKKKLTRDELIARRKELAYLKMRESQKSAKARMQNKIKSKKYHKLLKRQKMQEQIKQFELLQKTNPEAALEKLNLLEKNRVLERANLRHKNTGTWAKNLQVRAKYDKDVRKDLAEQLQVSRQLTQKKYDSDEEEGDESELKNGNEYEDGESAPLDPFNPWTTAQKGSKEEDVNTQEPSYRKYWTERNQNEELMEDYLKDIKVDGDGASGSDDADDAGTEEKPDVKAKAKAKPVEKKKKKAGNSKAKVENGWVVEEINDAESKPNTTNIDDIFDAEEDRLQNKLNKKLKTLAKEAKYLSKAKRKDQKKPQSRKSKDELKQLSDLTFKETAKRPVLDEELNGEDSPVDKEKRLKEMPAKTSAAADVGAKSSSTPAAPAADAIDPNQIAPVKLKQFAFSIDPMEDADYLDDNDPEESNLMDQQMTISEAFVDDDIVADFTKDKSEKSKIVGDEIQLSMPGWGSWAGAGISRERSNRNKRLVLKLAPEEKRRDENKGTIYINEETSKSLRTHLVSDVPFPFTSLQDYEASIRAPIGRNFVPETAFRMMTRPEVITRKGKIIEPMDESELVKQPRKPRNVVDSRISRLEEK